MNRLIIAILLLQSVVFMAACGGGSTPGATGAVATITVAPTSLSLNPGQVTNITAVANDSKGTPVLSATITYSSNKDTAAAGQAQVQVANNGAVCAGQWDSKTAPVVCTPSASFGVANLTASSGGITSSPVTVSVHPKVASVTITGTGVGCVSQGATAPANKEQFTAHAFDSTGADVTSQVGAFTWFTSNSAVASVDTTGLVTAVAPGQVDVIAQLNNVNSLPGSFITCPPKAITMGVTATNPLQTSVTLAAAGTSALTAAVTDTNGLPITTISLNYASSSSNVATVSGNALTATVTAVGPGQTSVIASCSPPGCNSGLNTPVYSNVFGVTVSGSSSTTVYATAPGASTIVPITTGTNAVGTAISVPQVTINNVNTNVLVNSMAVAPNGNRLYVGTNKALLIVDAASNIVSGVTTAEGAVMAISPNNVLVALNDTDNLQTLVFNANSSASIALPVANPVAAAFSADSTRLYLLAGNDLYIYAPPQPLRTIPLGAAGKDVVGITQGSLTYVAAGNFITALATCDNSQVGSIGTAGAALTLATSTDSTRVYGADANNLYDVAVSQGTSPCPPAPVDTLTTTALGSAANPVNLAVTPDGSAVFVVSNPAIGVAATSVLRYDTAAKTMTSIPLTGAGAVVSQGGMTSDGAQLWVGASTNDVHMINTATKADAAQVAVTLKAVDTTITTPLAPSIIAVRPH